MYRYGFIGAGNMGSALARALSPETNVGMSNRTPDKVKALTDELGFKMTTNEDIAENSENILLAVKPQTLPELCRSIEASLKRNSEKNKRQPVIITMAAGVKIDTLCGMLGEKYPVIRIMPNTPVKIGKGVILAAKNDLVSENDFDSFISDFKNAGSIYGLEENMIDAGSVISGCGPAYIYMYIEALAKAGEKLGLSYELSAKLAMETTIGSGTLALKSDDSLEALRTAVCSKGGSTIEGVKKLQENNLDNMVYEALNAAFERTKELGKNN